MALVFFLFRSLNFFPLAAAGVFVYGLLLWLFKAVSFEEVESLISKKGRRAGGI